MNTDAMDAGSDPAKNLRQAQLIPMDLIEPDPNQPRKYFDKDEQAGLTASIKAVGLKYAIIVRQALAERDGKPHAFYMIVDGERRWRSCKLDLGWGQMPCTVEPSEVDALVFALVANFQRAALNPVEEARGFQRIINERGLNQKAVAQMVGCNVSHLSERLSLLKLPEPIQDAVIQGMSAAVGVLLTKRCQTPQEMMELFERARGDNRRSYAAVTVSLVNSVLLTRRRVRQLEAKGTIIALTPEDERLAKSLLPSLLQLVGTMERLVGGSDVDKAMARCLEIWKLLPRAKQRELIAGQTRLTSLMKLFLNHITGVRSRRRSLEAASPEHTVPEDCSKAAK